MGLIALKDVHFAYPGADPLLAGASMHLNSGERLSVLGPNGAGKSTLLRLIVGLERPQSGQITAFDADCSSESDFRAVRRRVGLVFQDPDDQLFCPTVAEDVAFGPLNLGKSRDEAFAIVEQVLDQMGIAHLAGRITHKLSGGEKRLVTLATVLAMEPEVLLLDEPSNALDAENWTRLVEILQRLPQAILLVSHDPEFRSAVAPCGLRLEQGLLRPE